MKKQKAYLEVEFGIIITVLPYTDEAVYISYQDAPYDGCATSVRNEYFESMVISGQWVEMKTEAKK